MIISTFDFVDGSQSFQNFIPSRVSLTELISWRYLNAVQNIFQYLTMRYLCKISAWKLHRLLRKNVSELGHLYLLPSLLKCVKTQNVPFNMFPRLVPAKSDPFFYIIYITRHRLNVKAWYQWMLNRWASFWHLISVLSWSSSLEFSLFACLLFK